MHWNGIVKYFPWDARSWVSFWLFLKRRRRPTSWLLWSASHTPAWPCCSTCTEFLWFLPVKAARQVANGLPKQRIRFWVVSFPVGCAHLPFIWVANSIVHCVRACPEKKKRGKIPYAQVNQCKSPDSIELKPVAQIIISSHYCAKLFCFPAKMMTFLQLVIFLLNYLHHLNCGVRAAHFHVVQPAINIFRWNRHPSGNMMDSITWNQRNLRSNELRRDAHLVDTFGSALCGRSAVLWLIFLGNGLAAVALIKRLQRRPIKSDTGQRRKFLIRNGATIDRSLRCLQQEKIRKKVKHGAGWISEKNIQL